MSCPPNRAPRASEQLHLRTQPAVRGVDHVALQCTDRLIVRLGILAPAHNKPEIADDDSYLAGMDHDRVPNVMLPAGLKHLKVSKAGQNRILIAQELHAGPRSIAFQASVRFFSLRLEMTATTTTKATIPNMIPKNQNAPTICPLLVAGR